MLNIKIKGKVKFLGRPLILAFNKSVIEIGSNCEFRSNFKYNLIGINHPCIISTLSETAKIHIGNNCGFSGVSIGAECDIWIGNNVRVGANTIITDTDWHSNDYRVMKPKKVIIEDNVWIGVNCTILKGVKIGKNTVIGANSLVLKDIPENVVAGGNPCKIIKQLQNNENPCNI